MREGRRYHHLHQCQKKRGGYDPVTERGKIHYYTSLAVDLEGKKKKGRDESNRFVEKRGGGRRPIFFNV